MTYIDQQAVMLANINQDERQIDMDPAIALLAPRIAPFLLLSQQPSIPYGSHEEGARKPTFNTRMVINYEFKWLEDELRATSTQVNQSGGYTSSDTSLTVDDASVFAVGDLIDVVATGEILRVDVSNPTTNVITVTRSWGTTAAASLSDNDVLKLIGNVNAENSRARTYTGMQTTTKTNYIQTTRHPLEGSHAHERSGLYGQNQRAYLRKKEFNEHMRAIESSLLFGEGNAGTEYNGSGREYSTNGLLSYISTNVTTGVGTLSKATWNTWLQDLFTYGKGEKVILCSGTVAQAVNNFSGDTTSNPKSTIYVENLAKAFGINIVTYVCKFGTVHLIMHGLLDGTVYGGYAIGIEPEHIRMVNVRGGDKFTLYQNIQEPDRAGWKDEYRTDFGLEFKLEQNAALMTGVTG